MCCIYSAKIGSPLQILKVLLTLFKNKGLFKQLLEIFRCQNENGWKSSHKPGNFVYDGPKKLFAGIKFLSVVAPNSLITKLNWPVESCKHDSTMLVMSCHTLLSLLQQLVTAPIRNSYKLFSEGHK